MAKKLARGLTAVIGVGIIAVGARFILQPAEAAKGFGVPARPTENAPAYFAVKGVRDIATGLIALVLLRENERDA